MEIAKAVFYLGTGEVSRDGEAKAFWTNIITTYKDDLKTIAIEPVWKTQTITLDGDDNMIIGDTDGGVGYPQVIPFNAYITDGAGSWVRGEDFTITKGGVYEDDEELNAWYFRGDTSSVDGTLHYMRTYRNDNLDYAKYSNR
jgi:hypothetical protein